MKGINNRILHVSLTRKTYTVEEPGEAFYRTYLGGRGFALPYMLENMVPGIDPLGPDNIIVFATSILVGGPGPAMPRVIVCAKSPLTEGFGESEAGGWWGPELKRAGFDAITVTGSASEPTYIWIQDEQVEFRPARELWGLETGPAQQAIRKELHDENIRVLQIGPAGENLVRYANIVNELAHFNGRTGLGAVMGAKKLKAIAVRGHNPPQVADRSTMVKINRWTATEGLKKPQGATLHKDGTPALVKPFHLAGILPTRNWHKSTFDGVDQIDAQHLHKTVLTDPKGCFACPIRCKRVARVERPDISVDPTYGGPEYETIAALGSILEIDDPYIIAKANEVCNKNTIDTISTGMTIAFAMDCYENGLLTNEECNGMELKFGNAHVLLPILDLIIHRKGIGDLLAEGSRRAAAKIGPEAKQYTREVKGQEVPMHDPRCKTGVGMQYALADYGADHKKAPHDPSFAEGAAGVKECSSLGIYDAVDPLSLGPEKVRLFFHLDAFWSMIDMLGLCTFGYAPRGPIPLDTLMELVQASTGCDISLWEMMKAAERTTNLARIFNLREGFSRDDDYLPDIFFTPFQTGPNAGEGAINPQEFQDALDLRYKMMGWDPETTQPQVAKLIELDIAKFGNLLKP